MTGRDAPASAPVTFAVVGGFLGAGKTTTLAALARELTARGRRVALVANDQGDELVDTRLAEAAAGWAGEVTGGCFCCRFEDLLDVVTRAVEEYGADTVLAEAVGSCTDLQATVVRPLHRRYGARFRVAPLLTVVDPARFAAIGRAGEADLAYLFDRQLADADVIALNKADAVDPALSAAVRTALAALHPRTPVLTYSARTGTGLPALTETLTAPTPAPPAPDAAAAAAPAAREAPTPAGGPGGRIAPAAPAGSGDHAGPAGPGTTTGRNRDLVIDYDRYAAAEARLAWLNHTAEVRAPRSAAGFPSARWAATLLAELTAGAALVGHAKVHLTAPDGRTTKASAVGDGRAPAVDADGGAMRSARALVNARLVCPAAELDAALAAAVRAADAAAGAATSAPAQPAAFHPAYPRPVHRLPAEPPPR
ncbi:GTP-binding protein [Streptomyces aculeolatus]|uniref:GTP-binding protein n=1 Tax=Streptomyces aculeolatus TaxID=270689 RepID=UPI001CEC06A8|nr:GTP-binding protein [Streptomyces aculeolatus]